MPEEKLMAKAAQTAAALASKPPAALRASKRFLKQSSRLQLAEAMEAENKCFSKQLRSAEAREARRRSPLESFLLRSFRVDGRPVEWRSLGGFGPELSAVFGRHFIRQIVEIVQARLGQESLDKTNPRRRTPP